MQHSEIDFDHLWNKSQKISNQSLQDVFTKIQPIKLSLSEALTNFKAFIQQGKLPQGYTPVNYTKNMNSPSLEHSMEVYIPIKRDPQEIEKSYSYRRKFEERMKTKKENQEIITKQPLNKQQKSKQALAKLTIYNLPKSTPYKQKSVQISEVQSETQSMKLISENHDSHSGFNLRKQIFEQLTKTDVVSKQVLAEFLQKHLVFCDLYNIPRENIKEYVQSIRSKIPNHFSQSEFHCFLTNKNRSYQRVEDKPVCILSEQEWSILRSIYESLDCFGNDKVLKESYTTQMLNRYELLKCKLFLKDCIFFPEVQRRYCFEKVWDIIVNSETEDIWTWNYFRSLFLEFKVTKHISIDEAAFNRKFPREYNFIVNRSILRVIKDLFKREWIYYSLFVDKQNLYESIKDNQEFKEYSDSLIRTESINGLRIQNAKEALERFNRESPEYVDSNEILMFFSFNGMSNEDIYKHKLTLYDTQFDYSLVYKKKKRNKEKKKPSITIPIEFKLTEPRMSIRQNRLDQMIKEKEEEEMKQVSKKFKAVDVPITNDVSYNIYKPVTKKEKQVQSIESKVYHQITLEELRQSNDARKSEIRRETFEKYGIQEVEKQETVNKVTKSKIEKRPSTIPEPFVLSKSRQRTPRQEPIVEKRTSPKIQDILEQMKTPTKIPLTAKYSQQILLRKTKQEEQVMEKEEIKKQKKWKELRRKQFSKYMHKSLPKTITKEIAEWRTIQIKKQFKEIERRLAHQNEEQITQMYRRVLQKPFLFQTGSTQYNSKVNTKPLKRVSKKEKQMKCTLDQFIKNPDSNHFESTAAKNMFENGIDIESNVASQIDQSKLDKHQHQMEQNFIYEEEVESYEEDEEDEEDEEEQGEEEEEEEEENYSQEDEQVMRHSF